MSSGSRRLNYTQRRRIRRKHAVITLREAPDGEAPNFDATLELSTYSLPARARVFVEGYRKSAHQRFDFGTVGRLESPQDRTLTEFGSGDGVLFRIKVVEPSQDGVSHADGLARILAQADRIPADHVGRRRSLLALVPWDSKDEVWRLEIDEDTPPLLKVNTKLAPDRFAFARSPAFVSLVVPEVFRRVLTASMADGIPDDEEDAGTWQAKWVSMACEFMGTVEPPEAIEDEEDERVRWIDEVVTRFCRRHRIGRLFKGCTLNGGGV